MDTIIGLYILLHLKVLGHGLICRSINENDNL